MQKRKTLFSIAVVVLVLILAVAMLVACNDGKAKYTITFDDGSEVAKTVTLEEGTGITAEQIPTAQTKVGKNFDGWYVGETLIEEGYKPTANVTATAKYSDIQVTVNFVNGGSTTSATVVYSNAIASADLPADAQPSDTRLFEFEGWYDGETKFASDMTFTENTTFTAKFNRIAYLVTVTNDAAQLPSAQKVVAKNADGDTVLPEGVLPANTPAVNDKVFLGYYNGAVKAVVGTTVIFDDITLNACYVGEDDYDGLWVDETNKFVVMFDIDEDSIYFGTTDLYFSYFEFDSLTGEMKYNRGYGTVWTLLITGDTMTVVKTPTSDVPTTYVTNKAKTQVAFAGKYIRNSAYDVLKIVEDGYVFGNYGPKYEYLKISENGGVYTLTIVDDEGNVNTATVSLISNGIISISGDVNEAGVWLKDAKMELNISDTNYETRIRKYNVDGSTVYVFVDQEGVYSVVTADKEIDEGGTDIITLSFPDNSSLKIKLNDDEYLLGGNEAGTYTLVEDTTNTIELDGFGIVTVKQNGEVQGTFGYVVKSDNLIYIAASDQTIQLDGNMCSLLEADEYAGEYYQLNNKTYDAYLELDGFGGVTLYTGSYSQNKVKGTYTINGDTITIAGGVEYEEEVYDGTYTVLFDGETICCNGTYFGKEATDKSSQLVGDWVDSDATNTMVIDSYYSITITYNDTAATDIVPLKYDNTVLQFKVDGDVYVLYLENGELIVKQDDVTVATLEKDVTIDSKFIGSFKAQDDALEFNLVVAEKSVTLNGQKAINIQSGYSSLRFTVNEVDYTLYMLSDGPELDYDSEEIPMVDVNASGGGGTGGDGLITDSKFHGTWTWEDDTVSPIVEIVIDEDSVTFDGNAVEDLTFDETDGITFTYNSKTYLIYIPRFSSTLKLQDSNYNVVDLIQVSNA
ncbi:MAG: hypothetical protein NC037_06740 [Bacteroides sp.]|nr:hypothetical protein [Bacillota bacterium]MCM1394448.1 hypothetical protein [[Eubacterium] siraeum]MCM1456202.1 hypothetical protein [Bacteroides sp.]